MEIDDDDDDSLRGGVGLVWFDSVWFGLVLHCFLSTTPFIMMCVCGLGGKRGKGEGKATICSSLSFLRRWLVSVSSVYDSQLVNECIMKHYR